MDEDEDDEDDDLKWTRRVSRKTKEKNARILKKKGDSTEIK